MQTRCKSIENNLEQLCKTIANLFKTIEALKKYYKRKWHIHFKDFDPNIADASRKVNGDYFDAIGKGVFCKLGLGKVDFKEIITVLNELEYNDWIVVEQDILPGMGNPLTCAQYNRDFLKKLGV